MSVLRFIVCLLVMLAGSLGAEPLYLGSEAVPKDAIVLFDGKDLSKWVRCGTDQPAGWKVENGYMQVVAGTGDICTKQHFKDCQLHVEFWLPLMAETHGQERANSGVFFMGWTYEIQVLDSYGLQPGNGDCGAIYSIKPPMVNAARPPEQWQTYDMVFHAPRFDATGKKTANAHITVFWNGVLIHDSAEIPSPTPDHSSAEPTGPGPIELQDHGYLIRYRNVWVRPL